MTIATGTRLSTYEIVAQIGAGGMGEVYEARDTKLGRNVAIKVLPAAFVNDPERLSRFQREARMLAALNHPNIATIHGLEHSDGTHFLIMELVSGETLADRKREGAVPIEEALKIAVQIAEALEAAHEKGIIHRDLKPANVKVTPEGKVKVLDFGLAKAFAGDALDSNPAESPTLSRAATMQGVILGTAAYMSPEQARSKSVDKRTDIWAFGCVLYEMLTGKQAFDGEDITEILAAVVKTEPDWQAVPVTVPAKVRDLLRRCLQKDKTLRLRDAGDARIEIQEALSAPATAGSNGAVAVKVIGLLGWRTLMLALGALVLGGVVTGLTVWNLKFNAPEGSRSVVQLSVVLPPGEELGAALRALAVAPDGMRLVYVGRSGGVQKLYLRPMDSVGGEPISGTEGASSPFFSPDGQWLGFFAEGKLKTVPVTGGSPVVLCDAFGAWGGSWAPNDIIYFAAGGFSALWQVAAKGGTPRPFTKLDEQKGEVSHRWPQVLPGGKAVLFTVWTGPGWDEQQVELQMVESGERRVLVQGDTGYYVPTGHLVYSRRGTGTLMAVPFELGRMAVVGGAPVAVAEGVLETGEGAEYTFSRTGALAYIPARPREYERSLVWVDRSGKTEMLSAPPRPYQTLRLSPDGQQVALSVVGAKIDIAIYKLATGIFTRLTSEGSSQIPIWTPDGLRLTYRGTRAGTRNLYWRMADGSGREEHLTTGEGIQTPGSWSPDGRALALLSDSAGGARSSLEVLRLSDHKSQLLAQTSYALAGPRFSPDGHWLAYVSLESGRAEIYVQPYPGPGGKYQISTDGGQDVVWNRNGRELFYTNGNKMMAVDVKTEPSFSSGKPKALFEVPSLFRSTGIFPSFDVSANGQRFLMIKENQEGPPSTQINLVQNWFEELKRRVPTGK